MTSTIALANPRANYFAHRAEIDDAIERVVSSGWYIMGEEVDAFEREFGLSVGVRHCISVGSGTDALVLLLRALGIGAGDSVVTVSNTAVATVAAIDLVGARPLLVDVDPRRLTMSPEHLDRACRGSSAATIKAVIPVHLYGQAADLDAITLIAKGVGATVIEDCAQAHGAVYRGRQVGTIGDAAAFSFYPTKNLSALGDGGAVVTSDHGLASRCRQMKQYGWAQRYISDTHGMNTRLDEIQAAVLRVKLRYLAQENAQRRQIASQYQRDAVNGHIRHPDPAPDSQHVFHQYVVQSAARDDLQRHLSASGIASAILYPVPIHLQRGYAQRVAVGPGNLDVSEQAATRILSLPVYPELTEAERGSVAAALASFEPSSNRHV